MTVTAVELAGKPVERDPEGFLVDPAQWDREVAEEIARDIGIDELTPAHWQVIEFMRNRYLETGTAPSIRSLGKESGVPIKELYQLFPKGPAKLAAKIGGIPKPRGCI
jgi:tRNA 2-thiouridine synthesizing protein E